MKLTRALFLSIFCTIAILAFSSMGCLAQTNQPPARVTQAVDMHNLITLRGNVHPLARSEYDRGPAPDDLPMQRMLLVLQRGADQETSLRQLLDEQQFASSPEFHQWLTPEQFGRQFGPADSDLQAVTGWLSSQGFQVSKVAAGRTVIEFSGSAGLVRQVLGTEIHKFTVNGADYWANAGDPSIPAALAPVVAGIDSLNNFPRKPLSIVGSPKKFAPQAGAKGQPLFSFPATCSDGSSGCYYLTMGPGDFTKIYNMYSLWNATPPTDGTGVSIGVVGESNIKIQDVRDFRSMFGLPANDPQIIVNGPDPGPLTDGEETEADLDVEWSGGVAKGATVDFVVSQSTEATAGIDLSAVYIVDNNLAPILSESYGACEQILGMAGNAFYNALWEQAAAEGVTVLLGSGDAGSAGCDTANSGEIAAQYGLAVNGFASTPFNVAVGGTDFNLNDNNVSNYWSTVNGTYQASALGYPPEMTWNYSCASSGVLTGCTPPPSSTYLDAGFYLYAGAGGPSQVYAKPSWQTGAGVPTDGVRDIPDVSLVASDYYVICSTDLNLLEGGNGNSCDLNAPYADFQVVSGTSASAQAFAGVMALVVQAHGRQGNANYVFYPLAVGANSCVSNASVQANNSCIFYDTQVGNNSVICAGGSPNCSSTTAGQYGIMVAKGAPAYRTTAGYDLATGLGSVNVANLVQNWKSNFTPNTTSLSLSTSPATNPIQLVHGQSINFNIGVSATSGTPAGDVSLMAQTGPSPSGMTAIGPFTLSGGNVTGSTNMLPGGSYTVTAHYAGNGTFGSSDSSPGIPVTVTKESSKTQVHLITYNANGEITSTDPASVNYGSLYLLRMNVTNSTGNLCANELTGSVSYPCPSGSLTLAPTPADQGAPSSSVPGQYTLNTYGYAEDQYLQQPVGMYSFTANYAGDNSYNSSTSPSFSVSVALAPTTLTLSNDDGTTITAGDFADIGATITALSYGALPTGTIQYYKNGSAWFTTDSPRSVTPRGTHGPAYDVEASLPVGATVVTAAYSGDSNYAGSTAAPLTITVTDFSLSANPTTVNISAPGQSGNSMLTVAPISGFTGPVTLSVMGGCPTGATCTFASPSVTISGTSAVNDTLTITTTGSSAAPPLGQPKTPAGLRFPSAWICLLAGILALVLLNAHWSSRWRPAILIATTAFLMAGLWVACGGSSAPPTPPPTAPVVNLSPGSLSFSNQAVGSTSAAQSVTLSNTGNAMLTIFGVSLGGANSSDFAQTNNCGGSVPASAVCTFNVTFSPTAAGSRTGNVTVADNASGSPHTFGLTGAGAQPPTPTGTYPIDVRATSGDDFHDSTVTVVVQ